MVFCLGLRPKLDRKKRTNSGWLSRAGSFMESLLGETPYVTANRKLWRGGPVVLIG